MRDDIEGEATASGDELDQVFGQANPNPARVGCPPQAVRTELARRQRSIGDPWYLHLARCSECYREVRMLQASFARSTSVRGRVGNRFMAAAAVVLMLAGGAGFALWEPDEKVPQTSVAPASVTLDLRRYEIERGDQNSAPTDVTVLPRGRLSLTIMLPIASDPGGYDVQLVDAARRSLVSANATATLVDFVTTLRIDVDLSALQPGGYKVGVRRQAEDWRFFDVTIR